MAAGAPQERVLPELRREDEFVIDTWYGMRGPLLHGSQIQFLGLRCRAHGRAGDAIENEVMERVLLGERSAAAFRALGQG